MTTEEQRQQTVENTKHALKNLESYFSKSTDRVRQVFSGVEEGYAVPFYDFYADRMSKSPATTTFVTVFIVLNFWPVVAFLGLAFGTFSLLLGGGIFLALAFYACIFVLSAAALLCFLILSVIVTTTITLGILSVFFTFRSAKRLRKLSAERGSVRDGTVEWLRELKGDAVQTNANAEPEPEPAPGSPPPAFEADESATVHDDGDGGDNAPQESSGPKEE